MRWLFLSSVLLLTSCGAARDDGVYPLTVWNRSQYDLVEVKMHSGSSHRDAENLAVDGLEREEHLLIAEFTSGWYVTVIRHRVEVGELMAVTTEEAVEIDDAGYTLVAFDTSFRLLHPESPDNPYSQPALDDGMAGDADHTGD